MDEAARCDRILLIQEGNIIADDTPGLIRVAAGADDLDEAFVRLVNAPRIPAGSAALERR